MILLNMILSVATLIVIGAWAYIDWKRLTSDRLIMLDKRITMLRSRGGE